MHTQGTALDLSKLISLIIFEPFRVRGTRGNILITIVPNYPFGKRLEARDMHMCVYHIGTPIANIGYTVVYDGA